MVAAPNLTFTVTPPGGSPATLTSNLAYSGHSSQLTVTQAFGRQGDTATITLVDEHPASGLNFHVLPLSQVKLVDNTISKTLFAGVATTPQMMPDGPVRAEWTLDCTDYTWYADNALVRGVYYDWPIDAIIVDLTAKANCGISAAQVVKGGYVATAPTLASFVLNWNTLATAWRKLAALASQVTPYGWYVDENRALHFFDQSTALSSGVSFVTAVTAAGSPAEGHFLADSQFSYAWDATSIRNRIYVQGATQTITSNYSATTPVSPVDTWMANGTDQSWALRYTVTGSPTLSVNGVLTSVTVVTGGGTASGTWLVQQNSIGAWFLTASSPPGAGTVLKIWYDYQVPVVALANDYQSQSQYTGPNGGVYSEYISDTSLTTVPMAFARAMRERTEYAFPAERITFDTDESWTGWARAGQTCTIANQLIPDSQRSYALGVTDTFLVTACTVTFGEGGYRQAQLTAVRL